MIIEIAPGDKWDAQSVEVIWADGTEVRVLPLGCTLSVDPDVIVLAAASQRNDGGVRCIIHTGNGAYPVDELPLKDSARTHRNVEPAEIQSRNQYAFGLKSRVIDQQIAQAASKQERTEQQHQGESHLRDDERAAKPESSPACRHAAAG